MKFVTKSCPTLHHELYSSAGSAWRDSPGKNEACHFPNDLIAPFNLCSFEVSVCKTHHGQRAYIKHLYTGFPDSSVDKGILHAETWFNSLGLEDLRKDRLPTSVVSASLWPWLVKNPPKCGRLIHPKKIPWRRKKATHPIFWPGESP